MADTSLRLRSTTIPIRIESGELILPEGIGSEVRNMYLTAEGTLRSIWGPAPYVPGYTTLKDPGGGGSHPYVNPVRGIFHTRLGPDGEREVLLIQTNQRLRVFEGWNATTAPWRTLLGPSGSSAQRESNFSSDDRPRFPPQWEATPTGVVFIPSGESPRAYFYDGREILPLGYDRSPGPPLGYMPEAALTHDGQLTAGSGTHIAQVSGFGYRVGTLSLDSVADGESGRIRQGAYRAAVQWIDRWGNLSPISGRSSHLVIPEKYSASDISQKFPHVVWSSIDTGPEGTVGRILCRTKDEANAGTLNLFELSNYSSVGFLSPSTIPDNETTIFPDNTPDSWLIREPVDVAALTPFKLYALAFGRGWAANFVDDPGRLHPTMPGRWGTILNGEEIYPDPRGGEITGLFQVAEGLLVFTASTTFLVFPNTGGEGFQTKTIHPSIGCVAPSSIAMLPDGTAVWLGREGFYAYRGGTVELASAGISREMQFLNRARMVQAVAAVDVRERKYRCWAATEGSTSNNICWEYDGEGWTRRNDVRASDVCVTKDHRSYMLAAGVVRAVVGSDTNGVWLLDHEVKHFVPPERTSEITTAWLRGPRSQQRASPMTIYLWLRETDTGTMSVEVERDWRSDVTQTASVTLNPMDDPPPFWGTTTYGQTDAKWERRRPYWTRADIHVPSAEVFRLRITHTSDWEFIGMSFDEVPKGDTFRSAPK